MIKLHHPIYASEAELNVDFSDVIEFSLALKLNELQPKTICLLFFGAGFILLRVRKRNNFVFNRRQFFA